MRNRIIFDYKVLKKKATKLVAFYRMWREWCREFDKEISERVN